jgi:hypothetical protein
MVDVWSAVLVDHHMSFNTSKDGGRGLQPRHGREVGLAEPGPMPRVLASERWRGWSDDERNPHRLLPGRCLFTTGMPEGPP